MQPLGATTASMPNFYYIDLNKKKDQMKSLNCNQIKIFYQLINYNNKRIK